MSNKKVETVLALGADIKNRFLVAKGKRFVFGPDIGDLSDTENYEVLKREIKKTIKKFKPNIIAHDLHPGYFSTQLAKVFSLQSSVFSLIPVQHHYAHIASVIYEHNLKKAVIGVSFDGTGLGTDGNIWGGEFLAVKKNRFERLAHFKYIKMPGGDKVVSEPWRMVLSILGKKSIPFLKRVKKGDKDMILSMCEKNINSPLTSSAGRLFDAASALLGICEYATYEAEGPIKLEAICKSGVDESYKFKISKENTQYIIDSEPIFLGMLKDMEKGIKKSAIATKFHNSIANIIITTIRRLSKNTGIKDIALSGGVFQNKILTRRIIKKLALSGFNVFTNNRVPANDFNISLGQYYVSCCSG